MFSCGQHLTRSGSLSPASALLVLLVLLPSNGYSSQPKPQQETSESSGVPSASQLASSSLVEIVRRLQNEAKTNSAGSVDQPTPVVSTAVADQFFGPRSDFGTGSAPRGIAVADLNSDTHLDLAIANESSGFVSILFGRGDGTFGPRLDLPTGDGLTSVAIGELTGDVIPDVAVGRSSYSISIFPSNGDGTFDPRQDVNTGGGFPNSLAITDFNANGRLDIAAAVTNIPAVGLLMNQGGAFSAPTTYPTPYGLFNLASGDLNLDGNQDVVTANGVGGTNTVSVLLGNGDGTLRPKTDYVSGSGLFTVAIGDVNADGRPDLATANVSDNSVTVLLGDGLGGLGNRSDYPVPPDGFSAPVWVSFADFNGDSRLDMATANFSASTGSVFFNNGSGFFSTRIDLPTATEPSAVGTGDFDEDGFPDLAITNYGSGSVGIFLNRSCGVATTPSFALQATRARTMCSCLGETSPVNPGTTSTVTERRLQTSGEM